MNTFSKKEQKEAVKTARVGCFSNNAVVPKMVSILASKKDKILDYGTGYGQYTKMLRDEGLNIFMHDFSRNHPSELNKYFLDSPESSSPFDIIFASNVLNVQTSSEMLVRTLRDVVCLLDMDGLFVGNYPNKPRKLEALHPTMLYTLLKDYFIDVTMKSYSAGVIFLAQGKEI